MTKAERIMEAIWAFQEETGAELRWQLTCSRFASSSGALRGLCEFIAKRLENGDTIPVLEVLCEECLGRGWYESESPYVEGRKRWWCGPCGGAGYVPTEFGKSILALMRHNIGPMTRENP